MTIVTIIIDDHDDHANEDDFYDDLRGEYRADDDECRGLIKEEHDEFCLFPNAFYVQRMHFFFKSYLQLFCDLVFKNRE